MRYIDINKLQPVAEEIGWNAIKDTHLQEMAGKTPAERKNYINAHPDWNQFQEAMLVLSHHKCWYSEAPIGNSDFFIDHFRPKNRARQKVDISDPDSDIITNKENGYWWLAYEWKNYRLSGLYANSLRRDRLSDDGTVKGKGDYFPLDLQNGRVANDNENVACEVPILLDPCDAEDVTLLTFDSNGEVISAGNNEYEHNRVLQSIFYYHLDLEQLNKERLLAWKDCEREINEAKKAIDEAPDERFRRGIVKQNLKKILDYVKNPERPYTSVVKACIMTYAELEGFVWLKRFVQTVLI